MMVTTIDDRAEVFSRPCCAVRRRQPGGAGILGPGLPPRPLVRRDGLRADESPSEDSLTAMEAGNALEPE